MKTIVILGPESTGKTALAQALSHHFKATCIPEYARIYIEKLTRAYTYDDVETIARHQIAEYKKAVAENASEYLIIDTFLVITKVWFLHVYHRCPVWFQAEQNKAKVDLYLLCKPDIPWVDDPVRENPHLREYLYEWYKKELIDMNASFVEIGGVGNIRAKRAVRAIKAHFDVKK